MNKQYIIINMIDRIVGTFFNEVVFIINAMHNKTDDVSKEINSVLQSLYSFLLCVTSYARVIIKKIKKTENLFGTFV